MKIGIRTLRLLIAVFLLNSVESRPSSRPGSSNNNNDPARRRGRQRVKLPGPGGVGSVNVDFSQQQPSRFDNLPRERAEAGEMKEYRGPGYPAVYYTYHEEGKPTGISHVILPETAPEGQHTRVDYSYESPNPYQHPNPYQDPNPYQHPNTYQPPNPDPYYHHNPIQPPNPDP